MKIRIVNKFIAIGLVMLAVGETCCFADDPVLPRAFSGDYGRMVKKRLWNIEHILNDTGNTPFYPNTADRESLIVPSKSRVLLIVAISRAHNANGGSTINAVRGDLSATNNVAVSIFPDLTTIIPGQGRWKEQVYPSPARELEELSARNGFNVIICGDEGIPGSSKNRGAAEKTIVGYQSFGVCWRNGYRP